MNYETILCEVRDSIAYVTMNRPAKMNALNAQMRKELNECFDSISVSDEIRGCIITGSGKAFAAGADLSEINAIEDEQDRYLVEERMKREVRALLSKIEYLDKPVLAAINGYALGGGLELSLVCDIRCASSDAKFSLPEVKRGLVPAFGGTQRLSRIAGLGNAIDLCISGRMIQADEARAMGIVSSVTAPETLLEKATEIMKGVVENAPLAIKYNKIAVKKGFEMDLDSALEFELSMSSLSGRTEDAKEGIAAFNEKRPPVFKNR